MTSIPSISSDAHMDQMKQFLKVVSVRMLGHKQFFGPLFKEWKNRVKQQAELEKQIPPPPPLVHCPIYLQSGARRGQPCGKVCPSGWTTCTVHADKSMCQELHCLYKCDTDQKFCTFHLAEQVRKEEESRPKVCIRVGMSHDTHTIIYRIHGTNVLFDVLSEKAYGYIREEVDPTIPIWRCCFQFNAEVEKACKTYHIGFLDQNKDSIEWT